MNYHTVVFDLDGTLLNTLDDLADSTNYALSACSLPVRSVEEIRTFVGNGVGKLIARAVPIGTDATLSAKCLELFLAHYVRNMENKTAPYPGTRDLLHRLHQAGCALAIVSNKVDGAVKGLTQTYFDAYIKVAIGEREGVARKPAADSVRTALAELGSVTQGAVYVGDSEVDLETARNANLPCIAVTWGFRDRAFLAAHGATLLVDDMDALWSALS